MYDVSLKPGWGEVGQGGWGGMKWREWGRGGEYIHVANWWEGIIYIFFLGWGGGGEAKIRS